MTEQNASVLAAIQPAKEPSREPAAVLGTEPARKPTGMNDINMTAPMSAASTAPSAPTAAHAEGLGDESSIWFKLSALLKADDANPLTALI